MYVQIADLKIPLDSKKSTFNPFGRVSSRCVEKRISDKI